MSYSKLIYSERGGNVLLFFTFNDKCDNAIVEISQGNTESLSVIYRAYGKMIYSVGYQIVNNVSDAEDVLQEVMLNIVKYAHTYRQGTNPKAWILSITRNSALNIVKKRIDSVPIDDLDYAIDENGEDINETLAVREAINRLNEQERTILNLKLHIGLSHKEIASVLGVNVFAVQKKFQRALAKFKKYYGE